MPTETLLPTEPPVATESATGTVAPSAMTEYVGLTLSANPNYIPRGGELFVDWSIEGVVDTTEGLILRFYLPADVKVIDLNIGKPNKNGDILDVRIADSKGSIGFNVGKKSASPLQITVELLQRDASLAKAELNLLAPDETTVERGGGKAEGMKGKVLVSFPAGALSENVNVRINHPSKRALPVQSLSGSPFEVTAVSNQSKAEVSQFLEPVEIQVKYDETELSGDEEDLRLFWFDPTDQQWKLPLSQRVDTENNVLYAYTDHFTVFDTYNSGWQSAETPTMDFFQHAGYTGAASFSMPIKLPAGPGGFQPSLSLSYNSQVVDAATTDTQASWVGMGWSLDAAAYIERNGFGTKATDDDSYNLTLQGMGGAMWLGADGRYHLENENFAKITYNATTDVWTVLDKQGNQYYFEESVGYTRGVECPGESYHVVEALTWRWMLTRSMNIFGQEITYTYAKEEQIHTTVDLQGCTVVHDHVNYIYPSTILYANGRYRVRFIRATRYDYKPEWLTLYASGVYKTFQKSLLSSIRVEQDADGDGTFETLIRKYGFTYCGDSSCSIFPTYVWPSLQDYRTPTLTAVREYGVGGTNSLPPYSFTYGDGMHLTQATNGYGGTVTFTYDTWYQNIPYQTLANGLVESELPLWGNPLKCTFQDSQCDWVAVEGEGIVGGGNSGYIRVSGKAEKPIYSYQPGRWYRIVAGVKRPDGYADGKIQFGYKLKVNNVAQTAVYQSALVTSTGLRTLESQPFFLPRDTTSFNVRINSLNANETAGYNDLYWYYLVPLPTYSRVTSRTLSTGGNSYAFTYDYQGPSMNTTVNSAAANTPHPYTTVYSEFRGHAAVIETDPYGKQVTTQYGQTDCDSGKPLNITTRNASGVIMQSSSTTYGTCADYPTTQVLLDKEWPFWGTAFTGIGYKVMYVAEETSAVHDSSGVEAGSTTTTYNTYDAYGNLTQKTVSGTGIETTSTYTQYFPNISGGKWLVGLPARTYVKDSQDVTLSLSINLYDDASTYNTAPTQGVLTATRTLISGTNYSQTSFTHDAWGNVTSQTVWTGYGTASTAPTEGAQTTYTCYGTGESIGGKWCANDGYRTYALWTKNAKGHISYVTYDYSLGLPLTETDPNGAVTSATYDVFGRFKSLTKPGETSPSLNVSYVNNPFKVTLTQKIDEAHTFTVVRNYDGMGRQTSTVTNGVTVASTFDAYGRVLTQTMPGETIHKTITTYDALGRPLTVIAPDTTQTNYAYDGLTTSVTDANNHTHTTVTDILGRTLSVTPPTGPAVTFTYDALGNMLTAERGGATVILTYDRASRKLTMADPDMGNWSYAYNALGGMTSQTDARGCVTNITYDALNRPTGKTYSNCPSTPSVTYTYDAGTNGKGRRTSMSVTGADLTQWVYDERGRVTSENKQITDGGQFVTAFTYNSADLPVTMTYPDNEVVTFSYNNNMLPTSVGGTDTYAQSIAYDSAMRMIQLVRGANVINTVFDYNDWNADGGRLLNLTSTQVSTGTPLQNSTYDYDSVGNINTITDSLLGPQTQTFTYDALDRLISSDVSGGANGLYTESYSYDSATGNLASKAGTDYTYASGHAHAVASLSNGNTYGYDDNGNMTSRNVGGQSFTLNYDAENRLVSVSGAATATFTYDGDGKQIKATVNGTTTVYVGNHYEVKNSVVTKYYFAGTTRLAVRTGGTLSYLLGDHLGSSSVTTDANGAKTASALYKAFGETRYTLSNLNTDYKFTGQREEASLGIYFFNARWYDSSLGRFLSPDTLVPTSTQGTQAWDRYAFVNNNPVRYTDPTGHMADEGEGGDYTWQDQIHDETLLKTPFTITTKTTSYQGGTPWTHDDFKIDLGSRSIDPGQAALDVCCNSFLNATNDETGESDPIFTTEGVTNNFLSPPIRSVTETTITTEYITVRDSTGNLVAVPIKITTQVTDWKEQLLSGQWALYIPRDGSAPITTDTTTEYPWETN